MTDVKKQVESLLFSSGKVMTEEELSELIGAPKGEVKKALESLKQDYAERDTSLTLMESGEGWKLNVREQYVNLVTKIVADTELPFPILETLSIIAYKAPVMQADIIKVRGTNAYEHIQSLIDGGFIDRRKKGRSFEVALTNKFFEYFDVEGDKKLKTMLQDVKPSEPKPRRKIGDLKVVDIPEAEKQETLHTEGGEQLLGDLEVVPVEGGEGAEEKATADTLTPDNTFLDDIDARIDALSKKNDENETDESFKRMSSEEQPVEGEAAPETAEDATEEPVAEEEKPQQEEAEPESEAPKEEESSEEEPKEEEAEPAEEGEEEKSEDQDKHNP